MVRIKANRDSIGLWDGQEDDVLYNLNRVRAEIYNRIQGSPESEIKDAFKLAWDLFGSDDTLTGELSEKDIQEMAERIVYGDERMTRSEISEEAKQTWTEARKDKK